MNNPFKHRRLQIEVPLVLILAFYVAFFNPSLFIYKNGHATGCVDAMVSIRPLDDTLQGKVPFRDFYWMYGPLFLYIQLPAYLLLGQNHNALFSIWCSYLPFLSIVASYLWAAVFFPNTFYRLIFVLFCLLQNVNSNYPSLRHLMAELGIALFVLALRASDKKKLFFLSGLMSAAALLTSQEYGIASIIAISTTWLFLYVFRFRLAFKKGFLPYWGGIITLLMPYFFYLGLNGALGNYLRYTYGFTSSFGNPAAGEMFPVFPSFSFNGWLPFLKSMQLFFLSRNLRFYLPLIIYAVSFFYFCFKFYKNKESRGLEIFLLLFYGFLIFVRTLTGPDYGYFTYGLVPAVTLGLLAVRFLQRSALDCLLRREKLKAIVLWISIVSVYGWVFLTAENKDILNVQANLNLKKRVAEYSAGKIFDEKVGYFLSPKAHEELKNITEYIETHTLPKEYVLVYPWGPYNHLAKRPSPLTAGNTYDTNVGPYFMDEAVRQMETRKPNYVVLNTYNNLGVVSIGRKRGDVGDSATWNTLDSPSFAGKGDKLQIYILENYALEKQFEYAAIMKRRTQKRFFSRFFSDVFSWEPSRENPPDKMMGLTSLKGNYSFKVRKRKASIVYKLKKPVTCSHAEIVFVMNNGLLKRFLSKNIVRIILKHGETEITNDGYLFDLMTYNKQKTAWLGFAAGRTATIDSIKFNIETPAPYVLPQEFEVSEIKFLLESYPTDEAGGGEGSHLKY